MKSLPDYDLIASKLDAETDWPEPAPLPNDLPPVMPFDPELLPQALRGWVADIAHRMQCPPDFSAVGAMVAISSLIGARAVVAPKEKDDWLVVPNLWGLIVGRPGVMKSPALAEVLKPLNRLESDERANADVALVDWKLDCKLIELIAKDNESNAKKLVAKDPSAARALLEGLEEPPKPIQRRYVVTDSTVESLQDMLTTHPWGLMVYRDELHGLLASMDKQGQEQARGFYLQGYDGNQGYTVDRILRGTDHHTERVCLAMLGSIQPGKIQSYVRSAVAGGTGDDGLLQRFGLAVWPDVSIEWVKVDQSPDMVSKQLAWAVFERLNKLDDLQQVWRFSPQAQDIYWQWAEPFEREIRGDQLHPALISHLSKYRKLVPALALIFAMVDTPESGYVIHEGELLRALAWNEYLRTHAERMYAAAIIPETVSAKTLLAKIKSGKLVNLDGTLMESFTPRLVATKHWMGLAEPESVRRASDLLTDYGYLLKETIAPTPTGGRSSERYLISPKVIKWCRK
jgi:putative DNA primase/helicase